MRILTIILLMIFLPVAAAGTYKWVDKDGNTHYSDQPVEGAKPVELPEPTTFDAPDSPPRAAATPVEPDEEVQESVGYTQFHFISPKQDQVFWATGGEVVVQLGLKPDLKKGHEINLYFNGELTETSPMTSLGATLTEAWRGAHTVRAAVMDRAGKEIASAGPVTFHVKQRSIAKPK